MYWWLWNDFVHACHPMTMSSAASELSETKPPEALDMVSRYGETAFCWWNAEQGCHAFSDNWLNISGLSQNAASGNRLWEAVDASHQTELQEAIESLLNPDIDDPQPIQRVECLMHMGDEHSKWVELRLTLVPNAAIPSLGIMIRDIQEQKELHAHAHVAERMSQVAEHGRSSFLSNMSHELRTPLNAILGFTQMLEMNQKQGTEQSSEYLTYIRESGKLLLTKINDLIELSNVDAESANLDNTPINLKELIDNAIEMHSHSAFAAGVTLSQNHSHNALVVQGDRAKLLHIISHIVENAVRHSTEGDVITIRSKASAEHGVIIHIQDHGPGIADSHLNNIKQSIRSPQSYYATDIDNIGIGLSLAKEFTELHGGWLDIESAQDMGTLVTVSLPPERIVSLSAKVKAKPRVGLREAV